MPLPTFSLPAHFPTQPPPPPTLFFSIWNHRPWNYWAIQCCTIPPSPAKLHREHRTTVMETALHSPQNPYNPEFSSGVPSIPLYRSCSHCLTTGPLLQINDWTVQGCTDWVGDESQHGWVFKGADSELLRYGEQIGDNVAEMVGIGVECCRLENQ